MNNRSIQVRLTLLALKQSKYSLAVLLLIGMVFVFSIPFAVLGRPFNTPSGTLGLGGGQILWNGEMQSFSSPGIAIRHRWPKPEVPMLAPQLPGYDSFYNEIALPLYLFAVPPAFWDSFAKLFFANELTDNHACTAGTSWKKKTVNALNVERRSSTTIRPRTLPTSKLFSRLTR